MPPLLCGALSARPLRPSGLLCLGMFEIIQGGCDTKALAAVSGPSFAMPSVSGPSFAMPSVAMPVEERLTSVEGRLTRVEERLTSVETRLARLETAAGISQPAEETPESEQGGPGL